MLNGCRPNSWYSIKRLEVPEEECNANRESGRNSKACQVQLREQSMDYPYIVTGIGDFALEKQKGKE